VRPPARRRPGGFSPSRRIASRAQIIGGFCDDYLNEDTDRVTQWVRGYDADKLRDRDPDLQVEQWERVVVELPGVPKAQLAAKPATNRSTPQVILQ
jgi:hypothetical protein